MGKLAFLFPGQASQYPGMGKQLAEQHPAAKKVFDEADAALGFAISEVCFSGTEALKLTADTPGGNSHDFRRGFSGTRRTRRAS